MPLFQAVRRAKRWPVVLPLYDGRRCPDCGALALGDKGQELHRAHHEAQREWQEQVIEAIRATAAGAGLSVREATGGEIGGLEELADEQHDQSRRVSWRTLMADRSAAEDDDERLTAKARRALQGGEYDDEEDDDE